MAKKTVLYMAMSLDGFITGLDDNERNPVRTEAGHTCVRLQPPLSSVLRSRSA
jgi:hypothetical protein